jgi:uncharacterized membrane protein
LQGIIWDKLIRRSKLLADNTGTSGIDENIAGLLCYLFGIISGLIFFFIDKRPFVKFHAMQSIILSVVLFVVYIILTLIPILGWIIMGLVGLGSFILWVLLMVKAYQGQKWKLPVLGNLAEQWAVK